MLRNHRENGQIREEIRIRVCVRDPHSRGSESHLETVQHQSMNMKVFHRLECLPPLRAHTEYQWQVWGPNSDKAGKFRDEERWFAGNTEAAKQQSRAGEIAQR